MLHKSFVIVKAKGKEYRHLDAVAHNIGLVLRNAGNTVELEKSEGTYDLAISIGGDGTMMHAVSEFSRRGIPTIGINGGGVGFLTSGEKKDWEVLTRRILDCEYTVEKRVALEFSHKENTFGPFVNDVVLKHPFAVGTYSVMLDGEILFKEITADGVIVSTQTGSTAYNIAAGGPIVLSGATVAILNFIEPMRINMRPIVFDHLTKGGALTIALVDSKRHKPVALSADGVTFGTKEGFARFGLPVGDSITIRASKKPVLFATFGFRAQLDALSEKKGLAR